MSEPTKPTAASGLPVEENQLIEERREKLAKRARSGPAFPNDFKPRHHAADLQQRYADVPNEELEPQAIAVSVAGRMMLKRVMGKASFATLQDGSFGKTGGRIQLRIATDRWAMTPTPRSSTGTWATSSAAKAR